MDYFSQNLDKYMRTKLLYTGNNGHMFKAKSHKFNKISGFKCKVCFFFTN